MKYGIRDICDVVFKAKKAGHIGKYYYSVGQPVLYIDSAKTSTLEGASTTVYATGGRGNSRLIAWEGEKTLTFTVEDALLSDKSFTILSGAGLFNKGTGVDTAISVHQVSLINFTGTKTSNDNNIINGAQWNKAVIEEFGKSISDLLYYDETNCTMHFEPLISQASLKGSGNYVAEKQYQIIFKDTSNRALNPNTKMELKNASNGSIVLGKDIDNIIVEATINSIASCIIMIKEVPTYSFEYEYENNQDPLKSLSTEDPCFIIPINAMANKLVGILDISDSTKFVLNDVVVQNENLIAADGTLAVAVDYYTRAKQAVTELVIDADNFADNYYVEAKTSFRRQYDGKDLDTIITFPNVKIQSNFTFNMAATGDPSTFTFTMDAMPGTTVNNPSKKVLCEMFIVDNDVSINYDVCDDSIVNNDYIRSGDLAIGKYEITNLDEFESFDLHINHNEVQADMTIKFIFEGNMLEGQVVKTSGGYTYPGASINTIQRSADSPNRFEIKNGTIDLLSDADYSQSVRIPFNDSTVSWKNDEKNIIRIKNN